MAYTLEIDTQNARETQKVGREFGAFLRGREVIALLGDLGGGKTTFVQGLARALGVKEKIISPTFILAREYQGEKFTFVHLDLYRLEGNPENWVNQLGFRDLWQKEKTVVAIEWADKIKSLLPEETIYVEFTNIGENKRRIIVR